MKRRALILSTGSCLALLIACDKPAQQTTETPKTQPAPAKAKQTLAEARQGFKTELVRKEHIGEAVEKPPANIASVSYPSPAGELAAYVAKPTGATGKLPAIIWLVGGFSNSISSIAWTPGEASNDQSASVFWKAGIVTMYPSLRGGNENPGNLETFFGEVDDVLAAAEYLSKQPGVDPARIYLGGHSTGGTLAMLVAECGGKFRAVFAFGPADEAAGYGQDTVVFDVTNRKEAELRAPIRWMHGITSPTFVFEGDSGRANIGSLRALMKAAHPEHVKFFPIKGADHFNTIRPISTLIAKKILADTDLQKPIDFTAEEISGAMTK